MWDMLGEWHSLARFEAVGTIDPLHWLGALLQHVGPDFLFFTGDHNLRHHTGYGGMLNIVGTSNGPGRNGPPRRLCSTSASAICAPGKSMSLGAFIAKASNSLGRRVGRRHRRRKT